jgi:hypothetical protein
MARKLPFLLVLIFLISLTARAQDKVELFAGYSFEHYTTTPSRNLNGWELSGQYKFANWLGGVADLDAHYGLPSNADYRTVTFMAGPQISIPARLSPFLHVLVGVDHIRAAEITASSFAAALGGGIDMRIGPALSWRIFQADDVVTRFFGGTQHNPRLSTGIVLRF